MMLPLVVCILATVFVVYIYHQRGVFIRFICRSGVWRYHVEMSNKVPHAFCPTEMPATGEQGAGSSREAEVQTVESKFKDIYIGKLIQQKVDERGISYAEFARQIHCARTSLYHIFNSKNIDVERLLLISEVLQYDFINEVYLRKLKQAQAPSPYIVIPFKDKDIDTSDIPPALLELLKKQLL